MNTIMIKCPCCGAVLTVEDNPSNESKSVCCPICKERNPFSMFRKTEQRTNGDEDKTSLGFSPCAGLAGSVFHNEGQKTYELKEGVNLIGRKTYQCESAASVPIETDDMGFSRKHIFIEIRKCDDGTLRHYAYNASNKNRTTINGHLVNKDDKIILHNGDTIKSSKTTLVFKVTETPRPVAENDDDKTRL